MRKGLIEYLIANEINEVVLVFDMDRFWKKEVIQAYDQLVKALVSLDITVHTTEWNKYLKGIDDFINAGEGVGEVRETLVHRSKTKRLLIPIEEAREKLKANIKKIISERRNGVSLIRATTGVGKTTIVAEVLKEIKESGLRVMWLADTYALLDEITEAFGDDFGLLKGRSEIEGSDTYCMNKFACDDAGRAGMNVYKAVCASCPMKDNCDYHVYTKKVLRKKMIFAVKQSVLNNSNRIEDVDLAIFDESIEPSLFSTIVVTRQDIAINKLAVLKDGHSNKSPNYFFLEWLIQQMDDTKGKPLGEWNDEPTEFTVPEGKVQP